jgi:hypothetical protein
LRKELLCPAEGNGGGIRGRAPTQQQKPTGNRTERPPPIILTASLTLLKFQLEVKAIVKGSFEFHNTWNDIRVVAKGTADYSPIMRNVDEETYRTYLSSKIFKTSGGSL